MTQRLGMALLAGMVGAVVVALVAWSVLSSGDRSSVGERAGPRLTGWMDNFILAEDRLPAPEATLVGRQGTEVGLADFRGRVVLVNFWATWCAPCLREMPSLERLQARLGGEAFTVIAASQDFDGWAKIAPFLDRHGLDRLPVYHDPKARLAQALEVRGLPTSVLVGRDGREIGRLTGPAEWDSPEAVALVRHYLGD